MKIGLAQTDIVWEEKEKNKSKAETFIIEGKENGISLILFPEMSLTGFSMNVDRIGEDMEFAHTLEFFQKKAREYEIAVGIGYVLRKEKNFYNNYALIDKTGRVLCDYSKIHPFSYGKEAKHYTGGSQVCVCTIEGVTISPLICYDLRFPEIFQKASEEAELIVVPANWPGVRIDQWEILLKARAVENQCYMAGINRTGNGGSIEYTGASMLLSPYGKKLSETCVQEKLVIGTVDAAVVSTYRKEFPVKNDRKNVIYKQFY